MYSCNAARLFFVSSALLAVPKWGAGQPASYHICCFSVCILWGASQQAPGSGQQVAVFCHSRLGGVPDSIHQLLGSSSARLLAKQLEVRVVVAVHDPCAVGPSRGLEGKEQGMLLFLLHPLGQTAPTGHTHCALSRTRCMAQQERRLVRAEHRRKSAV
jgi:hypothetical protein